MTWKNIYKMVWIVCGHLIYCKLLPLPIKYSGRWGAFSHTCTLRNKTVRLLFPPLWHAQSAGQLRQQRLLISHTFLNFCKQSSWNISDQPVQRMSADGGASAVPVATPPRFKPRSMVFVKYRVHRKLTFLFSHSELWRHSSHPGPHRINR